MVIFPSRDERLPVVGSPYNVAPELLRGEKYDQKVSYVSIMKLAKHELLACTESPQTNSGSQTATVGIIDIFTNVQSRVTTHAYSSKSQNSVLSVAP